MRTIRDCSAVAEQRRGTTLSEILASLIVMSVGIVSVMSLFPISVLRTVQANQLTTSAQLKYDFDGLTGPRPEVVTGVGQWQSGLSYNQGDLVLSTIGSNRYFERQNAGTSGAVEPSWKFATGSTTDDGSTNNAWITHLARTYMVDPMGWEERTQEMIDRSLTPSLGMSDIRNTFGRSSLTPTILPMDSPFRIVRFRGGVALPIANNPNPANSLFFPAANSAPAIISRFGATQTCYLPDSWLLQVDSTDVGPGAATSTATSIQIQRTDVVTSLDRDNDGTVTMTFGGAEQAINGRVTLYGPDNKQSVVRQINTITRYLAPNYEQINWTAPLPGNFTPVRVRVETFQPRFCWMLAVRRQLSGAIYMDLITFYKRSFDPNQELIHPAHFRASNWPGANGVLGTPLPDADDVTDPTVVVQYNSAIGTGSTALRRGGFICDAQNNRWYRILSFKEVSDAWAALLILDPNATPGALTSGARGAVVRLEFVAMESSGIYTAGGTAGPGGAILLPGIINVYPLQPKLPWED